MKIKNIILSLIIVIFFWGCSLGGNTYSSAGYNSTFSSTSAFSNFLEITHTSKDIKLTGKINLLQGSCKLIITNPDNKIVEEIVINEIGKTDLDFNMKPIKGKWILNFKSDNCKGNYTINWSNK